MLCALGGRLSLCTGHWAGVLYISEKIWNKWSNGEENWVRVLAVTNCVAAGESFRPVLSPGKWENRRNTWSLKSLTEIIGSAFGEGKSRTWHWPHSGITYFYLVTKKQFFNFFSHSYHLKKCTLHLPHYSWTQETKFSTQNKCISYRVHYTGFMYTVKKKKR